VTTSSSQKSSIPWTKVVVWGGILVVLAFFGFGLVKRGETRPQVGDTAPDFSLRLFDGYYGEFEDGRLTLSDLQGRVVVINFWASWCTQCVVEAKEFEQTWQAYRDRGVVFVGIDYDDTEVKAIGYLEKHGITYPNGLDGRGRISGSSYHITGVPETFIVDPSGKISYVQIGPFSLVGLHRAIDAALAAP
jgi:cytochrome c biogenesis protein CcmG/thiol:disulfide interchange protein DsbE